MTLVTVPDGWNRKACIAWSENNRQAAIDLVLGDLNAQQKKLPRLTLQLCYYLFLLGDYRSAAKFLVLQLQHTPDHIEILLNLAVCLSRSHQDAQAVICAKKVLSIDPNQFVAWDVLASSHYQLQEIDLAAEAGESSLKLKDQLVKPLGLKLQLPKKSLDDGLTKKNVLAFSLWGKHPRYLRGALQNLLIQPEIYPGWVCRFYVDHSVPEDFVKVLQQLGAEIISSQGESLGEKLAWRFHVANDPVVAYFLVRDADAVINHREAEAVEAWINSGRYFHLMRDWWTHTDLILAGMWGGVAGVLPNLGKLYQGYASKHVATPNIDQWFLRDCVWHLVKSSCLIHDRCFRVFDSQSYPTPLPVEGHIGQNEWAVRREAQAEFLGDWLAKLPCLAQ
jgi:hypothetical protein